MQFALRSWYWLIAVAALVLTLGALAILEALSKSPSGLYSGWAQVIGTMLAIVGAVMGSAYHSDREGRLNSAQKMRATYLICRASGRHVVDIDRWIRHAALPDQPQYHRDMDRLRNYPEAWTAWVSNRYEGYVEALSRIELDTLSDAAFLDNVLTIRTRLKWISINVSPNLGKSEINPQTKRRLGLASRDVLQALAEMRKRTDKVLSDASLPKITSEEAQPFPTAPPPPVLKAQDHAAWFNNLRIA
jgi:hypothetical protein